ncbi:MAG: class I SAM-dependent methyltransferase [Alphaproteobacteria bacterium]|nr:class I SAM-dependent methyltransferase [Alphaproteobacteria bacterium]
MLKHVLGPIFRKGSLTLLFPGGKSETYGNGEPHVIARLHDRRAIIELGLDPDLKLGELYMDGRFTVENGDIGDFLDLALSNIAEFEPSGMRKLSRLFRTATRSIRQFTPARRAKQNVAHHYDLSAQLYDTFLDADRQYSCAYFARGDETLDEAQAAKKRHIEAKLMLDRPGLRVLDIGCGWGGLALDFARDARAQVLGITLSEEQIAIARQRSEKARLGDRCRFELADYRALNGSYDRIVSVGMFEHVGLPQYPAFFNKVRDLLADDGVMLLHTIGRVQGGPGISNPWITKYIFPGGYTPALSEVLPAIENAGLAVTDVEVLRMHYAKTLKHWQQRFRAHWEEVAKLYDERFCRMWDFYLTVMEIAFRREGLGVFQIQLAKKIASLPITRDYIVETERAMSSTAAEARSIRVA